jgi:hypothetical protein
VNSAGNEGNNPWRYITCLGDADGVLTVGAVDMNGRKPLFSSVEPTSGWSHKTGIGSYGLGQPQSMGRWTAHHLWNQFFVSAYFGLSSLLMASKSQFIILSPEAGFELKVAAGVATPIRL